MIEAFLESWPLFQYTYLAGWLIAILLSLIGVPVVARDQIFIGAAITQASAFGIATGMWLGLESDGLLAVAAVTFSIVAAVITGRGGEPGHETHEAITGWVFLLSASVSVLLLAGSPHGLEEIHRLLASSIIGATPADVAVFAGLLVVTVAVVGTMRDRLLLFVMDAPMAAAVGVPTRVWSAGVACALGLAVGLSIRVSGMLYTFGCLVLPGLVAKNLCREVAPMFAVAPAVALLCAVVAFVVANHRDDPPAQMTVAVLAGSLVMAWAARRAIRR